MNARIVKILTTLTLMLVMAGGASATEFYDGEDMPIPAGVLAMQETEVSLEDVEERQDVNGEMTCYAGSAYKVILQSTNYDYANGASLRVSFEESEGCELLGVLVEQRVNGDWEEVSEEQIEIGDSATFGDIEYLNDFRIRVRSLSEEGSNVTLYIKLNN